MKVLMKTQLLSIGLAVFWLLFLLALAFLDQPDRALQYINLFVYAFALVLGMIYFLLIKKIIGRYWLALPLILVPFLLIYKPLMQPLLVKMVSEYYGGMINFLALSTGVTYLFAIGFGLALGILFSRPQLKT
ncbi:hypothetical protein [Neobacillus jeddahensis]|uniref:hypothetical protein n=1 Tax=Neobacillus jeddahensis TaxID=1461580 RepID=UPI00058AC2A1|nr:hypothetical protein [Neobacillus jeddahensis]